MKLPLCVTVLGIPYTIENSARVTIDGQNADGMITYNIQQIEIVAGMPPEAERATLLHELLHAMFKGQGQREYQHDEALLEAVAHGVIEMLRDNPQLVSYLTHSETTS